MTGWLFTQPATQKRLRFRQPKTDRPIEQRRPSQ